MSEITVAIVGASGYGGAEIVRLLSAHPRTKIVSVTSGRSAGKPLREECPWLATDLILESFEPEKIEADFTFLCLESGFAMEHAETLLKRTRVIDLSADFRLKDLESYKTYYKNEHKAPDIKAAYGLPELVDKSGIAMADLVANPGCYPTATLLAVMPLVKAGLVTGVPVIDAKSGVSGAGRSRKETEYMFSELDGGFRAYAVDGHRHTPEIEQMLGRPIRFTPHLIPTPRGIHTTAHVPISHVDDIVGLYNEFYKDSIFVDVVSAPPVTKQVHGSNRCLIYPVYDSRTGYAVICSVIDNLIKGAAGQAIQNMNIMAGLPEESGLPRNAVWP